MSYIENPKTKDSGIICCIPQKGSCPNNCKDCFFQSGRSYLEPLKENLPNMPSIKETEGKVVRVNDGNDSNNFIIDVINKTKDYQDKFYNTSINRNLDRFPGPVVLTINPGNLTDTGFIKLKKIPKNLMFVRFRTNTWNLDFLDKAISFYSFQEVPVVITFMAYYKDAIPEDHKGYYEFKKRTLNSYWVVNEIKWKNIIDKYYSYSSVYSCGKNSNIHSCKFCGNCIREYYNTKVRMDK